MQLNLTVPNEKCNNFQWPFEKTELLKRGQSGKLYRNWDNEYIDVSQLDASSYGVQNYLF